MQRKWFFKYFCYGVAVHVGASLYALPIWLLFGYIERTKDVTTWPISSQVTLLFFSTIGSLSGFCFWRGLIKRGWFHGVR